MGFIDYEKAFHSFEILSVMKATRRQGVDKRYIKFSNSYTETAYQQLNFTRKARKLQLRHG